ncbi:MAG: beta-galactosidase, partial [Fervidobacterium pennivorans]
GGQNPKGYGLMGSYHDWQAPVSTNGKLKRSYFVLKNVIKNINNIEKDLLDSKPVFDTFFGFIPSYYSTEFSKEHGFDESELIFKRDISIFDGVIRGLKLLNYNFSGVNLEDEDKDNLNVEKYPSIWVFSYKYMPSLVQKKLAMYVENGGKLILFPEIPILDEFYRPYRYLHDYLGIASVEKERWRFANVFDTEINAYHIDKYTFETSTFSESTTKIFGRTYDNKYCAFKKTFSKGMVFVLGCGLELEREYKLSVIKEICNAMQIKQRLFLESKDGFVDGYLRESKDMYFVFLNNYDDYEKNVDIFIDNKSYGAVVIKARQGSVKKYEKAF